jgi:hypothetical protein
MLYNAHDAATNNGRATTNKRVSINENPFYIYKYLNLENNIFKLYYCVLALYVKNLIFNYFIKSVLLFRGL